MEDFLPETDHIEVYGARAHNLKNIHVSIPRDQLVVITGLSGSGKSSLAFDTIYAEGQRRYLETFSAYARQFLGGLERPEVDKITGLSPVISIEQKTVNKNPRSTVGTITEVYDFLRLLFARCADAYSSITGEKMVRYDEEQIIQLILESYPLQKITILAPLVKGRKGHYRELLDSILKKGFLRARIDGEIKDLTTKISLDRYKIHDIEVVVDRLMVDPKEENRIRESCKTALKEGLGVLMILNNEDNSIRYLSKKLMDPATGAAYSEPEPNTFSFNSPYGACPRCKGLGKVDEINLDKVIPDRSLSIKKGALAPFGEAKNTWVFRQIETILGKFGLTLNTPIKDIPEDLIHILLHGSKEKIIVKSQVGLADYAAEYEGVVSYVNRLAMDQNNTSVQRWAKDFMSSAVCPTCQGARLKEEALFFKIDQRNISEVAQWDLAQLYQWTLELHDKLNSRQQKIAKELIKEISTRLKFLLDVGLEYLTLNRSSKTLSGGEAQRIRLATQIGTQLVGVLYILDEPSIGLHQRDNDKLIRSLKQLRDLGNTVIVVEHDKDMMQEADYILDLGPAAGIHGGTVVAEGDYQAILKSDSLTAKYLNGKNQIEIPAKRREGNGKTLKLLGASGHNLKSVDLHIPLGKFVCVTGVSGSGKSSLVNHTLYPILNKYFYNGVKKPLPYKEIKGIEYIDKVIEIDQSPIGRTPRSNPATYTKLLDEIRDLFAQVPEAKIRGYKPGRFSFNTKGGRCEDCEGAGIKKIEMNFLPDVYVHCETCNGKRFNRETLEVRYKGLSISDVLDLTIEKAVDFFDHIPRIAAKVRTLSDVGLGYLTLGQQSTTLSGGEAQRVKLATELSKRDTGKTLYILDEPTTGLHFEDIRLLVSVLNRLVDNGNTVIVIEHNLDLIKVADHIIDLGPEGGQGGGNITAQGSPEEVCTTSDGYTAKYLRKELASLITNS
ncbi:MAG TPA: excinuclease ABC subunit UvrA [Luteibaculaceae bacterium]|nr:excinuclease ABC subunit UvrA [Luteibaculaceae bacterium]